MRILVTHDDDGNILSVAMSGRASDGDAEAAADGRVSRLSGADPERRGRHLHQIAQDFRVDLATGRPRLVRKQ